jgi:hypothetical protein
MLRTDVTASAPFETPLCPPSIADNSVPLILTAPLSAERPAVTDRSHTRTDRCPQALAARVAAPQH